MGRQIGPAELIEALDDEELRTRRRLRDKLVALALPGSFAGAVGTCLIIAKEFLAAGLLADVLRDVGIGFFVAALAVFGHELLRQVSGMDREMENLKASSKAVEEATDRLREFRRVQEDGAIKALLATSFPRLRDCSVSLFEALRNLEDAAERDVSSGNKEFIQWYLSHPEEGIARYMRELGNFCAKGHTCELRNRDPRELAGHLLGAELAKLSEPPAAYDSITNPLFYGVGVNAYGIRKTEEALSRCVRIRRIFNLSGLEEDPEYARSHFAKAKQVVQEQLRFAQQFPSLFEIRFVGSAPFSDAGNLPICIGFPSRDPKHSHLSNAKQAYYGLFHSGRPCEKSTLVVSRDPRRMTILSMCRVDPDCHEMRTFDLLWSQWATECNPFAGRTLDLSVLPKEPATL